uniref:Reverse transcriptase zinc-binding domain-containing protein n=1 Tax=Fagus sylvatica TaxID=28930 RepID=A0A2N9F1D0_FAGSY
MKWSKLCKVKEEGGIGFRDLHAFNLALLAQQVWRLTQNSESLLYRVYKAKYFPSCSFLNAKIGSNPSFIWRSFLGARDLVKEGSKWKTVHELIDVNSNRWNEALVNSVFEESSAAMIKSIALPFPGLQGKLIWSASPSFSVESAYSIALHLTPTGLSSTCESSSAATKKLWRKIWKLRCLSKEDGEIWAAAVWAIWFARNKLLHDGIQLPLNQILDMGQSLVQDYKASNSQKLRTSPTGSST